MQMVFLTHMSRSGSTLLSRLLDQFEDISVGIEGYFPDNIIREAPGVDSNETLDEYLDLLFQDKRFLGWELNRSSIKEKLQTIGYPLSYQEIMLSCFLLYFGKSIGKVLVHKCGPYIYNLDQLGECYPGSKVIYIIRDPRAILNSHINSGMSNDPLSVALTFKKQYQIAQKYKNKADFFIIQYEELLLRENQELDRLLSFLEVENRSGSVSDYSERIPKGQKYLHSNVSQDVKEERIIAWRDELDPYLQILMQTLCSKEIRDLDLPMIRYEISPKILVKLISHVIRFKLRSGKHWVFDFWGLNEFPVDTLIKRETSMRDSLPG